MLAMTPEQSSHQKLVYGFVLSRLPFSSLMVDPRQRTACLKGAPGASTGARRKACAAQASCAGHQQQSRANSLLCMDIFRAVHSGCFHGGIIRDVPMSARGGGPYYAAASGCASHESCLLSERSLPLGLPGVLPAAPMQSMLR
jgi:hypothetical protein